MLFRRLLTWLLGWQWVHCENSATEIIRRVRYTTDGRPYVIDCGAALIWLHSPGAWCLTPLYWRPEPQAIAASDAS